MDSQTAWLIISALAGALQAVSIYLFRRVDGENRELKAAIKESTKAAAETNVANAQLAAKYPALLEQIERMMAHMERTLPPERGR